MNIKQLIDQHKDLLQVKETSVPDLFVLKYKRKVFYDACWTPFLKQCRGLVINSQYQVVSQPFDKIYNFRKEADSPDLDNDEEVDVIRKVNGFMVAMTSYNGTLLVSTTGSIDSDFVTLAKKYVTPELETFIVENFEDQTAMFECCDPSDPHIVEEEPGLYLLGIREKSEYSEVRYNPNHEVWNALGVKTLPVETMTIGELEFRVKECRHEGFVAYTTKNDVQLSIKWKSPYYLVKKLFMRGNLEKLFARDIKQNIDEEYYGLVDAIKIHKEELMEMEEQQRRKWIEDYLQKL